MSGTAFETGATLVIHDDFTRTLDKFFAGLDKGQESVKKFQLQLDKLGPKGMATRAEEEMKKFNEVTKLGIDKFAAQFDELPTKTAPTWKKMVGDADEALGLMVKSGNRFSKEFAGEMETAGGGAGKAFATGFGAEAEGAFAPAIAATRAAMTEINGIMSAAGAEGAFSAGISTQVEEVTRGISSIGRRANSASKSVDKLRLSLAALAKEDLSGLASIVIPQPARAPRAPRVAAGAAEGATLGGRTRGAHSARAAHSGGLHFGQMGGHVGGTHVGLGGDGIVPAVGGFVLLEGLKEGVEAGMNFQHWESQYEASGISMPDIDRAKKAAWENAGLNPNLSATQGLQMIFEANKMTGNVSESIDLLPTLATTSMAMQSVKAEDLHSHFNEGHQIFNFSKYLEEVNATSNVDDKTPEARLARTQDYAREAMRTMIFSRGVTDGNSLYAMSNNSKGTAANWDERMATVYAPLIGDVMRHSKLGNADFMALKSYQGGHITSDAVEGLMKYGLAKVGRDTFQDSKKQWHLMPNSPFAEGMEKNFVDWSREKLKELEANGYDINNQTVMNGFVNAVGSNGSTANMMRSVFEPGPRNLLNKEIIGRDRVPNDAASILQERDPVLKLDALHKKWEDLLTAVGGPLVDPAIAGLTKITAAINAIAQAAENHPDITKYSAEVAGVLGVGLLGYGGGKMLGLFGSANTELTKAAGMLQEAAVSLGAKGAPGIAGGSSPLSKGGKGPAVAAAEGMISGIIYELGEKWMDHILGWTPKHQEALDHATSLPNVVKDIASDWFGIKPAVPLPPGRYDYTAPNTDGNALHRWDEMPAGVKKTADAVDAIGPKFGELKDKAGIVLTSFGGLDTSVNSTGDVLKLFGTGAGSASHELDVLALATRTVSVAMAGLLQGGAGGMGGGGLINASWGGGGGFGGGSPDISGAFRGSGPGIGHTFSASEREANIRAYAAKIGINPDVAMAVAKSEGFGRFDGDHGTSFGDLQMHIGGGLGDLFRRRTGLNPADSKNELVLDRFALDQAKAGGWAPWHGAAAKHIYGRYGMDYHGPVPTAGPPPKKVTPGAPASSGAVTADARPLHVTSPVYLDGRKIAQIVTKHQAAAMRHPTDMGGPDPHSSFVNPGTPLMDTA